MLLSEQKELKKRPSMGEGVEWPRVHPRSLPETPSPVPKRRGRGRRRWHRPAGGARGAASELRGEARSLLCRLLHTSWVGCDKSQIQCVVTYQGDAPNPHWENYRATNFQEAPGALVRAAGKRLPLSGVITAF